MRNKMYSFSEDKEFSNFNIKNAINESFEEAYNDKEKLKTYADAFRNNISKGDVYSKDELPFFEEMLKKIEDRIYEIENPKSDSFFAKNKIAVMVVLSASIFIGYKIYKKYKK